MRNHPILSVILFVAAAVLMAALYTHGIHDSPTANPGTAREHASGPDSLWADLGQVFEKNPQEDSLSLNEDSASDAERCRCTRVTAAKEEFKFEDPATCPATEVRLSPVFREVRSRRSNDFPRICLTYILKKQGLQATNSNPNCAPNHSCVTETYVNGIYNLFGDLTTCLGQSQRESLPRFFADGGFNRMTEAELKAANVDFEVFKNRIAQSEDESCRTVRPYLEKLPAAQASCELSEEGNPLRSIFYFLIRSEQNQRAVRLAMVRQGIPELLRAGKIPGFEDEQLQDILGVLGSEVGANTAIALLKNYLQVRLAVLKTEGNSLTAADFDLARAEVREPASVDPGHLSFLEYLKVYQGSEAGRRLSEIASHAHELNSIFKEGTCVPESYLSLSF